MSRPVVVTSHRQRTGVQQASVHPSGAVARVLRRWWKACVTLLAGASATLQAQWPVPGYAPQPLWLGAKIASMRYRTPLPPAVLAHTLATGHLPRCYVAHVSWLLEEAPMPLLAMMVKETSRRKHVTVEAIWSNMAAVCDELALAAGERFRRREAATERKR